MSRRSSSYRPHRPYRQTVHVPSIQYEHEIINETIYGERASLEAITDRIRIDQLKGQPEACVIKRATRTGWIYWLRAWALKTNNEMYRIYVLRFGVIESPWWFLGPWPTHVENGQELTP